MLQLISKLFKSNFTGVKVLAVNHLGSQKVLKVYDDGKGAYIESYFTKIPIYLRKGGGFVNPSPDCNGESTDWMVTSGDLGTLKFYDEVGKCG